MDAITLDRQKVLTPSMEALENLMNLEPGVIQCYYKGFLGGDIGAGIKGARYAQRTALAAYYAGTIELVQISLGFGKYEYLAIGTSFPRAPKKKPEALRFNTL